MATYFIDPYKKYYDELSGATNLKEQATMLSEKVEFLKSRETTLESQLSSAIWQELGCKEVIASTLPLSKSQIESLSGTVTNGLIMAVNIAVDNLLPIVKDLKMEDENCDAKKNELDALVEPTPITDSITGKETDAHIGWRNNKSKLQDELGKIEERCKDLITKADAEVNKINGVNKAELAQPVSLAGSSKIISTYNGKAEITIPSSMYRGKDGTLLDYGEYYIADTIYPVLDYQKYALSHKFYQDGSGGFEGSCQQMSMMYAMNMTYGENLYKFKDKLRDNYYNKEKVSQCGRYENPITSDNVQDILNVAYNEIVHGRPVPLSVKGPNGRHWVTIVGFKTSVKDPSQLKKEDLLVLDPWDGEIERMDCEDSRVILPQEQCGRTETGYRINILKPEAVAELSKYRNA